ncbi:DUF4873 domain-containing protein [Mycobacteroides chelonae]|uniref:DUF4873 domain-containing protein n=1 Tax=Mycobacteroides chelonae TaxID=1774 RepID=UPI003AAE15EC
MTNTPRNDAAADYRGPAILVIQGEELDVQVVLRGFFQPIDGTYRWHGRTSSATASLTQLGRSRAVGILRTPYGEAAVTIDEIDLWGRYRLRGNGHPPFPPGSDR